MSISAAINDLGALASARSQPSPRAQAARSGDERDDAFGQMLRDSAKEPPAAPGRDADWLADRARSDQARAEERPQRDKPELPDAPTENRSDNARRSLGPRNTEQKASCERRDGMEKPPAKTDEAKPSTPSDASAGTDATKIADEATAADAAAAATSDAAVKTTEQATAAVALAVATPAADGTPAATDATTPTVESPQVIVAAQVAAPVIAQGQGSGAGEEAPTVSTAVTAATPAATTAAAELLAEAAPAAVEGAEGLPTTADTGDTEATSADKTAAKTAGAGAQATLPEAAMEALAALKQKKGDAAPGEHGKALGHAKEGKALGHAKHAADVASAPGAAPTAEASQPTGQPAAPTAHAAATLEAVRASLTEGQPQGSQSQATGVVSISAAAPSSEVRAANLAQAAQRHEIPVPMQAVAIEIGMRAMRGAKEFAIRLDPEDLGRIDVKLEISEAGQVQAKVVVDKVETLQLLQRDARTLERAFDQAGLKTSPDGLQFSLRDQGGQNRNGGDQPTRNNGGRPMTDEAMIDDIRLQPAQYRTAATSGLDIRI